jgi:hypothetical protein
MFEKNYSRLFKFFMILMAVNIFLVFVWMFIEQRDANKKLHEESTQMRDEISKLQNDMKKLGPNTKEEIQQSVAEAKEQILMTESEAVLVKNYRNSMASISSIKLVLSEYFMNEGKFPERITPELIGDVHQYETGVIESIELVPGDVPRIGVVLQNFDGVKTGGYHLDGRYAEAGSVHWDCKAFGDELLKRALPECEYIVE